MIRLMQIDDLDIIAEMLAFPFAAAREPMKLAERVSFGLQEIYDILSMYVRLPNLR